MPRVSRFVLPNVVHHVVARGVNKTRIFRTGFEKDRYLKRFAIVAEEEKVLVHGYCLMNNHVHWLVTPTTQRGLAKLFQRVHTWWAMEYNKKHDRTGHLFQSRYHSVPLDEEHYWEALRYVELNPQTARLVKHAREWEHSSVQFHTTGKGGNTNITLVVPVLTRRRYSPADWRIFLTNYDPAMEAALLAASAGSRPFGDSRWVEGLEHQHHRRLTKLRQGRPRHSGETLTAA